MIHTRWLAVGAIAGVLTGLSGAAALLSGAHHVAHIFKSLLELVSLPIIFLSIVSALTGMNDQRDVAHIGGRVLRYTLLTTIISALIGMVLFLLIQPTGYAFTDAANATVAPHVGGNYLDFLLVIVPSNFIQAFSASSNVTSVVFLALLLGMAILSLPQDEKQRLHGGFAALFSAMLAVTRFILALMPIGIWAFLTIFVSSMEENSGQLVSLGLYVVTVLLANLVQGTVVLPLFLWFKNLSPRRIFDAFRPAIALAFVSKSSNMALPVTLECAQERAGIRPQIAKFVLPLCSTINMNGCAAFILITVLFVATGHGATISLLDMFAWVLVATVAAVGNAGVPMGCFFLTSAFLAHLKLPLHMMGVILPLYTLLDMVETGLNVWSDSCVAAVVNAEVPPRK